MLSGIGNFTAEELKQYEDSMKERKKEVWPKAWKSDERRDELIISRFFYYLCQRYNNLNTYLP